MRDAKEEKKRKKRPTSLALIPRETEEGNRGVCVCVCVWAGGGGIMSVCLAFCVSKSRGCKMFNTDDCRPPVDS